MQALAARGGRWVVTAGRLARVWKSAASQPPALAAVRWCSAAPAATPVVDAFNRRASLGQQLQTGDEFVVASEVIEDIPGPSSLLHLVLSPAVAHVELLPDWVESVTCSLVSSVPDAAAGGLQVSTSHPPETPHARTVTVNASDAPTHSTLRLQYPYTMSMHCHGSDSDAGTLALHGKAEPLTFSLRTARGVTLGRVRSERVEVVCASLTAKLLEGDVVVEVAGSGCPPTGVCEVAKVLATSAKLRNAAGPVHLGAAYAATLAVEGDGVTIDTLHGDTQVLSRGACTLGGVKGRVQVSAPGRVTVQWDEAGGDGAPSNITTPAPVAVTLPSPTHTAINTHSALGNGGSVAVPAGSQGNAVTLNATPLPVPHDGVCTIPPQLPPGTLTVVVPSDASSTAGRSSGKIGHIGRTAGGAFYQADAPTSTDPHAPFLDLHAPEGGTLDSLHVRVASWKDAMLAKIKQKRRNA